MIALSRPYPISDLNLKRKDRIDIYCFNKHDPEELYLIEIRHNKECKSYDVRVLENHMPAYYFENSSYQLAHDTGAVIEALNTADLPELYAYKFTYAP